MARELTRRQVVIILAVSVALVAVGAVVAALGYLKEPPIERATAGILTGVPCEPPCWQGVSPGDELTPDELVAVLETLPNARDSIWFSQADDGSGSFFLNWIWTQWPWDGTGYNGWAVALGRVTGLWLSADIEMTVEEIIDKYGFPAAVNYGPSPLGYYVRVNMYYPTHGMVATASLSNQKPVLQPSSGIIEVSLSTPADSVEPWFGPDVVKEIDLEPWPGYVELELK